MWPYPKIVAHRGAGILAPENTLAAMRLAHARGFKGVEFDVMLSRDAVPVLMHDPFFGRIIAGCGSVAEHTAAELAAMDAGSWRDVRFAGEPVPAFETVAQFCRNNGIWMNVEIKPAPGADEATGAVVADLTQRLFADALAAISVSGLRSTLPLLASFSMAALLAAKHAAPAMPRACLVDRVPVDWQEHCASVGAVALHVNQKHLTPALAQSIRRAGYGLFCYTVNDPARARQLLAWGVDGFCTDRLDLIGPDFA